MNHTEVHSQHSVIVLPLAGTCCVTCVTQVCRVYRLDQGWVKGRVTQQQEEDNKKSEIRSGEGHQEKRDKEKKWRRTPREER